MTSSSADIFNRLQLFRTGRSDDEQDSDPERPRPNPATSRVKRCLFGRGNHEENIKFAKRELEKSLTESKKKWYVYNPHNFVHIDLLYINTSQDTSSIYI